MPIKLVVTADNHLGRYHAKMPVTRLDEQKWRWTAADPSLRWLTQNAAGMDVTVEDVSETIAALARSGVSASTAASASVATSAAKRMRPRAGIARPGVL
mgnify:CR=1 FL=1